MKKIFLIALLLASTAWSEKAKLPEASQSSATEEIAEDTIVKPTPAQKETLKSAARKAKANKKESSTTEPEILVPPEVSDDLVTNTEVPVKKLKKVKIDLSDLPAHRFGLHADLNVPHVLNYGVDYWHTSKWFSASLNFGGYAFTGLQKSSDLPNGADIKIANQEAVLRLHPFQSAFFLALSYGSHTFEGTGTATYSQAPLAQPVTTTIKNKITANYVIPHLGWMWRADSGFTWGIDFGYLIPNGGEVTLDEGAIKNDPLYPNLVSTPQYKANRQKIIDDSEKVRTTSLPYWALARVGWLF